VLASEQQVYLTTSLTFFLRKGGQSSIKMTM
jgi:hypothetical protein